MNEEPRIPVLQSGSPSQHPADCNPVPVPHIVRRPGNAVRRRSVKKELLYRVVPHNGGAVFATPKRAALIARIHDAIKGSATWGEFRAAMPRESYSYVIRAGFDENGKPRPRGTDPFCGDDVPGWSDGGYPPWLQPEMDRLLPRPVLEQFGVRQSTWLNGNFWMIPRAHLPAMCAALIALGWELRHAPDLHFH